VESRTLKKLVPTDATTLGMIRAVICGFVFCEILLTNLVDLGRLPATVVRPTGAMQILPWRFYDSLLTPPGMLVLKCLLVVAFLAAAAGFLTSIATKSAAILFLFYEGLVRSFGHFNHDEMPVVYILIVLAFTPCGDAFSLDSLVRRKPPRAGDVAYGYPILLMRILLAWSYFSSALIKLRVAGLGYFNADNLPTLAILHSLDNLHDTHYRLAFWLPHVRGIMAFVVLVMVLWELAFPLAIFSRIGRRVILPMGVLFHVSTIFLMNVFFPYHLTAYAVFIDWGRLITGNRKAGTRFHNHNGQLLDAAGFLYLPKSVLTALYARLTKQYSEVPLLGFRASKHLARLINPDWKVLEFGSGMSTIWFARRCASIVSIEINEDFFELLSARLAAKSLTNVDYRLRDYQDSAELADYEDSYFDLVLVDGVRRDRAMMTAIEKVKPGGYIYLDNSDYPHKEYQTARAMLLKAAGAEPVRVFNDLTPSRVWVTEGMLARIPQAAKSF
jgi:hypothetical protein